MADQLPPEQDESLIDMATRYGKEFAPAVVNAFSTYATEPLDAMQWLATHGNDPDAGIVTPNQIETPEQLEERNKLLSSIPNSSELASKYLLPEVKTDRAKMVQTGIEVAPLVASGAGLLLKTPKAAKAAFSWGAKILGKTSPSKATALTTDAFHGTRYDFPAFVNNPNQVARGETNSKFILDQALGTHFAKDPNVSNTFVIDRAGEAIEGGSIIPAKIPDEKTFLEVKQDLLPYITDRSTPRGPSTVHSDQDTIEKMIAAEGFKAQPNLLTRYLVQDRKLPEDVAASISQRLAKGKSVRLKEFDVPDAVSGPPEFKFPIKGVKKSPWETDKNKKVNLEQFLNNYGGKPHNVEDRAALVDTARKSWQDKGYTGLKYLNTSKRETEFATDPTSYIVFDPKHTRSRFAQFNPADVESSDLLKSHGGPVHMGKGGLLKAGAEELVELAAKYLPKKVIPHGDPQREANLAKFLEGSKAVTNKSEPIRVYHGSAADISEFKPRGGEIYFSDSPSTSNIYAEVEGGNVTPAYLSLKKPAPYSLVQKGYSAEKLKKLGYDGYIENIGPPDNPRKYYIVFSPEQVKSAVGNRGTFDPTKPDIGKASGGLSRRHAC